MTRKVKIYLLNGPPGSGKDTLADELFKRQKVTGCVAFATPIKRASAALFDLDPKERHEFDNIRSVKDTPQEIFMEKSWRDVCIIMGEGMKKEFGKELFGCIARDSINSSLEFTKDDGTYHFVLTDCGFEQEVFPLIEEFGAENVTAIKLVRVDHDYTIDSRDYIDCEELGITEAALENYGTEEEYLESGVKLMEYLQSIDYASNVTIR